MPSIVGISCNPEQSKKEWQSKVSIFQDWEIIEIFDSPEHAQRYGESYANMFNSNFISELDNNGDEWCVYRFDYLKFL